MERARRRGPEGEGQKERARRRGPGGEGGRLQVEEDDLCSR